ncbi:MAG: M48 family metallopeptidase [Pseudomonadota bacterium]
MLLPARRQIGPTVGAFLKALAHDRLVAASDAHAATLGQSYEKFALRDTRSRWGSCSSGRRLMYSWRLILAPPDVLNYVAAHEVSHLVEMNHSSRFWAKVAELCPDFETHRAWLRREGASLHRYRFDA